MKWWYINRVISFKYCAFVLYIDFISSNNLFSKNSIYLRQKITFKIYFRKKEYTYLKFFYLVLFKKSLIWRRISILKNRLDCSHFYYDRLLKEKKTIKLLAYYINSVFEKSRIICLCLMILQIIHFVYLIFKKIKINNIYIFTLN